MSILDPKPDELNIHVPISCVMHSERLNQLAEDMKQVRVAVCGDESYGIHGLVREVDDLRVWRKRLDLRVAAIAGAVSTALALAKWFLQLK